MPKFVEQLLPKSTLDQFKYEIAKEIGILPKIENGYWGDVTAEECGKVGGEIGGKMVKAMIKRAETMLINKYNI
ncbi:MULTISPECIES: alpha/beta-type small acid-soluble spore protein [Carboxydocella]|uniref:Small, acid-soluble spore protein, alpha/beta type n=2 Tax=Carboxydocella TaxID=178898 RepID=A0A1T4S310_9FIRM|nr:MULTISPECIES: alpha/beta-type small acid-soluble spore protein [Carboxydocella]AVX20660.1 Small, acid-soluble spore protein, alpha/beta type [Carboxydocella thermautotrophica]GAW28194.1 spore protein alpha/beta [Carboxydocella sp. ULO1]GAW32801.1 spore protein alpha/beta [Carboxydocella sp. JDF658]SKA22615.1 Small, acid-soluble spore protein, alpha/beta type [Carboxydocella sporoproducens DSM 16521]